MNTKFLEEHGKEIGKCFNNGCELCKEVVERCKMVYFSPDEMSIILLEDSIEKIKEHICHKN